MAEEIVSLQFTGGNDPSVGIMSTDVITIQFNMGEEFYEQVMVDGSLRKELIERFKKAVNAEMMANSGFGVRDVRFIW